MSILSSLPSLFRRNAFPLLAGTIALALSARAAPALARPPDFWRVTTPQWLTEASTTVREGYDTNVFGTKAAALPGTPDIANLESSYTSLNFKATVNLLPLLGSKPGVLSAFSLGYSGTYTSFDSASHEDNLKNDFTQLLKGKSGPWSGSFDNALSFVAGPQSAAVYSTSSPWGYAATRERRRQIQDRTTSLVRYDGGHWFGRATASVLYYDLLIDQHNPVGAYKGYVNWIDRNDVNGGFDLGYKVTPAFAYVIGWRLGEQTQARLYYSPTHNDSTYNRALIGFEGKPVSWLQVQFVAGPEFHRYSDAGNLGLRGDHHNWLYTESSLTATLPGMDTLGVTNKIWHWVASGGSNSYQETSTNLTYKHSFTKALAGSIGLKVQGARYDTPSLRNDWLTTVPVSLSYTLNPGVSISAEYNRLRGRSEIPEVLAPGRDWDQPTAALSVKFTF